MITNTLSAGLEGIRKGTVGMQDAATRIARAGTTDAARAAETPQQAVAVGGNGSLVEALVDLKVNQRGVEASVEVVKAADEMVGTLLDERA